MKPPDKSRPLVVMWCFHPHGVSGARSSVIESRKCQLAFHVLIPLQILPYVFPLRMSKIL